MARGKLLKTKVKAEKALTKARLQATKEWELRNANFTYLAKKELVGFIRRMEVDPIKIIVFGGTVYLIYNTLIASQVVLDRVIETFPAVFIAGIGGFATTWMQPLIIALGWNVEEDVKEKIKTINVPLLLMAILLAYLLMEHGDTIVRGTTGLVELATGLLS